MNITEEQLEKLKNLNDSRVNEILNMTPELNKWYKATDNKFMIYLTKYKDDNKCEGFYFSGLNGEYMGFCDNLGFRRCILATKQEIEQALTNEAKRRGFKEGIRVKLFDSMYDISTLNNGEFTYQKDYNRFGIRGGDSCGSFAVLFKDGQWAEIIDDKTELTFEEYQKLSIRTCNDLGDSTSNDTHMIFGMVTEVAELADAYKKHWAYGKELDMVNVKEELGDLLFYISNFAKFNNINLGEIMYTNVEKLKARYPEKFTNENATNRDLETERQILENGH